VRSGIIISSKLGGILEIDNSQMKSNLAQLGEWPNVAPKYTVCYSIMGNHCQAMSRESYLRDRLIKVIEQLSAG
jgi:hypothetical protein